MSIQDLHTLSYMQVQNLIDVYRFVNDASRRGKAKPPSGLACEHKAPAHLCGALFCALISFIDN